MRRRYSRSGLWRRWARAGWSVLLALLLLTPSLPVQAAPAEQIPFPPGLAHIMEMCMTQSMGDAMTGEAWVEQAPNLGWRVVLPLRGQPNAPRMGVQSPPPAVDTLAWLDFHQYASPRDVPNTIDNMSSYIMMTSIGETFTVHMGGYYWLRIRNVSQKCFETTQDARMGPV